MLGSRSGEVKQSSIIFWLGGADASFRLASAVDVLDGVFVAGFDDVGDGAAEVALQEVFGANYSED